jgi:hypothetical protein
MKQLATLKTQRSYLASLALMMLMSSTAFGQDGTAAPTDAAPPAPESQTESQPEANSEKEAPPAEEAKGESEEQKSDDADSTATEQAETVPPAAQNDAAAEAAAESEPAMEEYVEEDAFGDELAEEDDGDPSLLERRIVAFVASGVSVISLGVGGVFAGLAWQQNQCLQDVVECNKTLDDPIEGTEFLDAKTELEHKAVIADMAFLFAGAAALVAVTGFVRGFVFTGEEEGDEADMDDTGLGQSSSQPNENDEPTAGFTAVKTALTNLN